MRKRLFLYHHVAKAIAGCAWLSIVLVAFTGCKESNKNAFDPDKPTVTVTIEPFRYFVEQIADDDVNINVMVPAGSNPETYEPTPKQMVDLGNSVLYFKVGAIGFEKTWMDKLKKNAPKMQVIDTSAGIYMTETKSGYIDPHTWMSIENAKTITANITQALMKMFPDKADKYKEKHQEYCQHLNDLAVEMEHYYYSVSECRQTSFVIYHPILTYFARDYGMEQFSLEDEGREPSISQVQDIINRAKSDDTDVLFIQKEFANRNVQTFIDATKVKPIEINPLSYDWEGQMLYIMKCISKSRKKTKASHMPGYRQSLGGRVFRLPR